ncbi:hypothetical protein ABZU86_30650 [Streptomyces sp. NPDC005271]|uniref:hypothetical protein n=1 Tax=unclassified Streptomyces TaxID=2593676 RepID=UPI0033BD1AE7
MRTTIESEISKRTEWDIDFQPTTDPMADTGTRVELWGKQSRHVDRLLEPKAAAQITAGLAPYLLTFPDVRVTYDGKVIDPRTHIRDE